MEARHERLAPPDKEIRFLFLGYFVYVIDIIEHCVVFISLDVVTQAYMNRLLEKVNIRVLLHDAVLCLVIEIGTLILVADLVCFVCKLIDLSSSINGTFIRQPAT